MKDIIQRMGFSRDDAEKLEQEIEKFLTCEKELQQIKRELKTIKISLILVVVLTTFSVVS